MVLSDFQLIIHEMIPSLVWWVVVGMLMPPVIMLSTFIFNLTRELITKRATAVQINQ